MANKELSSLRFPPVVGGIEVNTCSNVSCENFGMPPKGDSPKQKKNYDKRFNVVGISSKLVNGVEIKTSGIKCKACGGIHTIHSNRACFEEFNRLISPRSKLISCKNTDCENNKISIEDNPSLFRKFGVTSSGSRRYLCKSCSRTFSVSTQSSHRLRKSEKTAEILKLLINKVPMRRICEIADISASLLYQRIDRIYDVFSKYSDFDRRIFKDCDDKLLHFCSDVQDITLNWNTAIDRRVTVLKSIASAEMKSGFVVAQHVNFDPETDPLEAELDSREINDQNLQMAFRRYARIWLPSDFRGGPKSVDESADAKVFSNGAMVRQIYTQYGHFLYLSEILKGASDIQFSLDPDPGIQRAVLMSFKDKIATKQLQACLVSIQKDMTVTNKKLMLAKADTYWETLHKKYPSLSDAALLEKVLRDQMVDNNYQSLSRSKRWIEHPLPSMNEPYRRVQLVTRDESGYCDKALWAIARASLRSIDRYFMLVRRRLSLFERPIVTSSSQRTWYGYQAYNPYVAIKVLEIFRIIYNYHLTGTSKKTPAQRLGVTDKALTLDDLLSDQSFINNF